MSERRAAARARYNVLAVKHASGEQSHVILDGDEGPLHQRSDLWLRRFRSGTQRTYAYHLVDHLRWLATVGRDEATVTMRDLHRYMGLCGAQVAGPLGDAWLDEPLDQTTLSGRATVLKAYYVFTLTGEDINGDLLRDLRQQRVPSTLDRSRGLLGHTTSAVETNPLAPPRARPRDPRLLPDGTDEALLAVLKRARDRMLVIFFRDSGMRVGEVCGLWLSDLHLTRNHTCGDSPRPHVHVVHRQTNPNGARAKRRVPTFESDDAVVRGGIVRSASPAMIDAYHEYMLSEYAAVQPYRTTQMLVLALQGVSKGQPLGTAGVRNMLRRASKQAGLATVRPHSFRHNWSTDMVEASDGDYVTVAKEGGWSNSGTLEDTYSHVIGSRKMDEVLDRVWNGVSEQ